MTENDENQENQQKAVGDSTIEVARMLYEDTIAVSVTDYPLVEQGAHQPYTSVIDLACGSGDWVMDVARMLPETQVMGVDMDPVMTDYGRETAKTRNLNNVHFMTVDILKPLTFADNTFDFISARNLVAIVSPKDWPGLLRETFRICQPGGVTSLFEVELAMTNSLAFEQVTQMILNSFVMRGLNFGPTARNFGITALLPKLLKDAGYANVRHQVYSANIFSGSEGHENFQQRYMLAFQSAKVRIVQLGLTTPERYDELCQQVSQEMQTEEFCAVEYKLSAWGEKPKL